MFRENFVLFNENEKKTKRVDETNIIKKINKFLDVEVDLDDSRIAKKELKKCTRTDDWEREEKKNAIDLSRYFLNNVDFRFLKKHIEERINFTFVIKNDSFDSIDSKNDFIEMKYSKNNVTFVTK